MNSKEIRIETEKLRKLNKQLDKILLLLRFSTVVLGVAAAIVFVSIVLALLSKYGYLTIFEDGSYWLFDWAGCLPFSLCN